MLKKHAIASGFSEPGRKPDKFGSKLVWGCPQLKCWALETSHPTCQAGQLRQPGWKQQSSSRVWSPFGHQWNQWPWPKERAPGLAESASSYAHPNTCFGATSAPESMPFESVMKCCDSCSQQRMCTQKALNYPVLCNKSYKLPLLVQGMCLIVILIATQLNYAPLFLLVSLCWVTQSSRLSCN